MMSILYYEFHGDEKNELIILNNGVFMNTTSWVFQLPALTKRYRVLAYDMRGQGQSEHPESEYSLEFARRRFSGVDGCAEDSKSAFGRHVVRR